MDEPFGGMTPKPVSPQLQTELLGNWEKERKKTCFLSHCSVEEALYWPSGCGYQRKAPSRQVKEITVLINIPIPRTQGNR